MKQKIHYNYLAFAVKLVTVAFMLWIFFSVNYEFAQTRKTLEANHPDLSTGSLTNITIVTSIAMAFPLLVFVYTHMRDIKNIKKANLLIQKIARQLTLKIQLNTFQRLLTPKKFMATGKYRGYEMTISSVEGRSTYLPLVLKNYLMIMMRSTSGFKNKLFVWNKNEKIHTKDPAEHRLKTKSEALSLPDFSKLKLPPKNFLLHFAGDGYIIYTDEKDTAKIKEMIELSTKYAEKLK